MTAARGRRRRRKRTERTERLTVLGTTPEERLERTRKLADALEAESLLAKPTTRRALSEALAMSVVHLGVLTEQRDAGQLTGDEARTIPALLSNVRKLAETAGVDHRLRADDCRECMGTGREDDEECAVCGGSGVKE